jgi:hypothetical protein
MPANGKTIARDRTAKSSGSANTYAQKLAQKEYKRHDGRQRAVRKLRLLTTQHLDGRSRASQQFNSIVRNVVGGQEQASAARRLKGYVRADSCTPTDVETAGHICRLDLF